MKWVKLIVGMAVLTAVVAAFFGVPACWVALKIQGLVWGVAATFLFGRFFCEAICPLGILQTVVRVIRHPKRRARRVCTRLPESRAQRIVRWSVMAVAVALGVAGCMGLVEMVLPISIFGKAMILWWPGLAMFAVVMVLAAIGDGRIWCNWICPFGTIFNLVSKIAIFRNRVGEGCANCRKCFPDKGEKVEAQKGEDGVTRRETLSGFAVLAATADDSLGKVTLPGVPERGGAVLPPGALSRDEFALRCAGCQLCVANCPGGCLKPSTSLKTFGQPMMDFRYGYCIASCAKCGEICPEGAIRKLQDIMRPNVHMGHAIWRKELCVRTTNGDKCTACVRKCPVQAIHLVDGFPVVDRDKCIGCGACEHVCPARPQPAIFVKGYDMQRIVKPISEADLIAEMKSRIEGGAAVLIAKDGVIAAAEEGRGLKPLIKLLDEGKLHNAIVVDKVIGRAAAAICAVGGAKKVYTMLAGKGAAELLAKQGITLEADKTVELILNRDRTGSCPMEKAVSGLDDPKKMLEAIRKEMAKWAK